MTRMIQTTARDWVHPQDFVRRRRWAPVSVPRPRHL
jgi:hypothetical protein